MTNQQLADQLGIKPDVLLDARRFLDSMDHARSRVLGTQRTRTSGKNSVSVVDRNYFGRLALPQVIHGELHRYLNLRGIHPQAMARGLIHYFLLHPELRITFYRFWPWRGQRLLTGHTGKNQWPWWVRYRIPYGVSVALRRRARFLGVPVSSILRSLILELLGGKLDHVSLSVSPQQLLEGDQYPVGDAVVRDVASVEFAKRKRRRKS